MLYCLLKLINGRLEPFTYVSAKAVDHAIERRTALKFDLTPSCFSV